MKKRILALFLAAAALLAFSSCGSGRAVMRYEGYSVSASYYTYWLSRFKANFLYYYSDVEDNDAYYSSVIGQNGETAEEVLTSLSDGRIMEYLIAEYLFDHAGLTLPEATAESVDALLDSVVEGEAAGDKKAFDGLAAQYGVSYADLREIYRIEAKSERYRSFYKTNVLTVTDAERDAYFEENYARTVHIYIATEYRLNIDENGTLIYDENGDYRIPYTEAEKAAQRQKIAELEKKLTPENFDALRAEYNEDPAASVYENGYYLSGNTEGFDGGVIAAALAMEEGEVRRVDADHGVFFLKKLPRQARAYSVPENADFFDNFDDAVKNDLYEKFLAGEKEKVTVDAAVKDGITIRTVSPCRNF